MAFTMRQLMRLRPRHLLVWSRSQDQARICLTHCCCAIHHPTTAAFTAAALSADLLSCTCRVQISHCLSTVCINDGDIMETGHYDVYGPGRWTHHILQNGFHYSYVDIVRQVSMAVCLAKLDSTIRFRKLRQANSQ